MVLEKLIGLEQKNAQKIDIIAKQVGTLVALQQKQMAMEKNEQRRNAIAERVARSDRKKAQAPSAAVKKEEKKNEKNFIQKMMDGLGVALAGVAGLASVKGALIGLAGAAIVGALRSEEIRKALFEALKFAFDKVKQAAGNAAHGLGHLMTGGGFSDASKAARAAIDRNEGKKATQDRIREFKKEFEAKEAIERKYYVAAFKMERARQENAPATQKRYQREMDEYKEQIDMMTESLKEQQEFADKYQIPMDQLIRMRTLDEMHFGTHQTVVQSFDPELLRQTGRYNGKQRGGPIRVPGQGTGDSVPAILPPGSFVMNRKASGFQMGGVPVMLEPGEDVYGPGQWGPMEFMMNSMIPRFQSGGEVSKKQMATNKDTSISATPQSEEGSARGGSVPSKDAPATSGGGKGSDAIIKAAEASIGMLAGVPEMCARTTRNVLAAAGHPAANKRTMKGDLDPEGTAYNGPDFAASFAGTDMGTVGTDISSAKPGSVLLWKGTYGQWKGTDAITHVGIAGEGNTQYDHGSGPGWRKRARDPGRFAYSIDLNGEATGTPQGTQTEAGSSAPSQGLNPIEKFFGAGISGLGNALGVPGLTDYFGVLYQALADEFKGGLSYLFGGGFGSAFSAGFGSPASASQTPAAAGSDVAGVANASQTSGGGGLGGISVSDPNAKALLAAISKAEGTPSYGTVFGGAVDADLAAGNLTVQQAIALGDRNAKKTGSGATGKYQFMPQTLEGLVSNGVLKMNDKFTNELQDKAALALVKGRGVNISDGLSMAEIQKLSWEWASIKGNNYTFGGKAQGYVDQSDFLKDYEGYGGKAQAKQRGGVVHMQGAASSNMRRFAQAQQMMEGIMSQKSQPIVVPVPMGGGGGGGTVVTSVDSAPPVPNLPDGPNVVALLELQNRLAVGMNI